jgi:hypothetical protein
MHQCRAAPMPAADSDGEEAHYSCRICFEDAKPSEVSMWAEQQQPGRLQQHCQSDVAVLVASTGCFLVLYRCLLMYELLYRCSRKCATMVSFITENEHATLKACS